MGKILSFSVFVCMFLMASAWGAGFLDDFDRPNGAVGNGWSTQTDGTIEVAIVDNEVLIAGQQGTDWVRAGISRDIGGETRISFDFKADDAFNVHIRLDDAETSAFFEPYWWPGGPCQYATSEDGSWPGWTEIAGSNMIAGEYNTLVIQQDGATFTMTLNDVVIGSITNNSLTSIGSILIASDAAAGTTGSIHIDNVQIGEVVAGTATNPSPAQDASDVPLDAVLGWTAAETAVAHDVYFGTVLEDVDAADRANPLGVLLSQGQTAATYDLDGMLEYGQTYYWRVDEVNAAPDSTIIRGNVWNFTVEPYVYQVENIVATASSFEEGAGPENTVNGSGLNAAGQHSINAGDMWLSNATAPEPAWIQYEFDDVYKLTEMSVWNYNVQFELVLGFGLKDVTVEYSPDGVEWTVLGDYEFSQATAKQDYVANTVIDLDGVAAKFVRLTANSNWGGMMPQFGLSEVEFLYKPVVARDPDPADGQVNVALDSVLDWRGGREAATHDVYLSSDRGAVEAGTALVDSVSESRYAASGLELGMTYYWRVDEVNDAADPAVWEGSIWSFSTLESILIDDFESYDDEDNRIYDTWLDGWVNGTGSIVGYLEAPFAERSIVNSGYQSMPLEYDNSIAPYYSETTREFDSENWTAYDADTLFVSFRGRAAVFTERADGSILMGGGGADIWGTSDQFRFAYKQLSGDGSIVVRVDSVENSDPWAKAGVMIRQNTNPTGVNAAIFVTPENGISFQYRTTAGSDSANVAQAGLAAPYWVKLTRTGDVFTAQYSADGTTWTDLAPTSPVEISMTGSVLIGLAVTSHNSTTMTNAEFSNASTAGGVSGAWQVEAIGVEQPGNDAAPLYVTAEDTSGHVATVTYPDEAATLITSWVQWQIPQSDFVGVNMARVRTLSIGIGNPDNPSADGTGLVYIDDIAFGHPASAGTE